MILMLPSEVAGLLQKHEVLGAEFLSGLELVEDFLSFLLGLCVCALLLGGSLLVLDAVSGFADLVDRFDLLDVEPVLLVGCLLALDELGLCCVSLLPDFGQKKRTGCPILLKE